MAALMSNLRRASVPLQESSQQIGIRARQILSSAMSAAEVSDEPSSTTPTPSKDAQVDDLVGGNDGDATRGKQQETLDITDKVEIKLFSNLIVDAEEEETTVSATTTSVGGGPECRPLNSSPVPSPARAASPLKTLPNNKDVPPSVRGRATTTWTGLGGEEHGHKLVVCNSRALPHLFTRIRDRDTPPHSFKFYAKRMMRILAEEGIACLESSRPFITTPTGATFSSVYVDESNVCVVSILRAGDALAEAVQACLPRASVGKVLIQRDEASEDKHPVLFYKKLPPTIATMQVLLCDPMLATAGSARMAIRGLVDAGVKEPSIVFVTVVVCPEGLTALRGEFPEVTVVTGAIDDCLDERCYIVPGLGDFGDRFFGTVA